MIAFDKNNLEVIDISQVHVNSWNPKRKDTHEYVLIRDSIKRDGQKSPVVVRDSAVDGFKYEVIDGEQRYTSLKELDESKILIYKMGEVSDADAMNETLWWQLQVPFVNEELADVVKTLLETDNILPFDDSEIESLLELDKFDLDDFTKEDKDDDGIKTLNIKMNENAFDIVMKAINAVREEHTVNDARALELICADYLSSN